MISRNLTNRYVIAKIFHGFCFTVAWSGVLILGVLLFHVTQEGIQWLDLQFLSDFPSRFPAKAGIHSALIGTLWLISLTALFSVPIGIGAGLYLEEFTKKNRIRQFVDLNISNLAGVPSIVYGMLGLVIFVRWFELNQSVLAGSLTMSLLILPVIIISTREALRAVPNTIRQAAFALGATRWQTIYAHVLPAAFPGILTGIILALSRAIGETAPLIMIGALTYVAFVPDGPMDDFTALPIQIFNWASRPQQQFHELAAAGILVLLFVLLLMNSIAVFIRHRLEKKPMNANQLANVLSKKKKEVEDKIVLQAHNLNISYDNELAVKDVSIDIPEHSITAIIGPSGCGKSTLLRSFNRMNDFILGAGLEGKVLYRGIDLYGKDVDPVEVRRKIGMVFQKPNPFPKSIFDNIAWGPLINGYPKKGIYELINTFFWITIY